MIGDLGEQAEPAPADDWPVPSPDVLRDLEPTATSWAPAWQPESDADEQLELA